jgi:hypothetical protein
LIRAAAFLLQLLIKLSADMKVKEIEEEEFVQENHLNLQKKNARNQAKGKIIPQSYTS